MPLVAVLPSVDLRDIPERLERIAKDLREGSRDYRTVILIGVGPDEAPHVFGYGERSDPIHAIAWLAIAEAYLTSMRCSRANPSEAG